MTEINLQREGIKYETTDYILSIIENSSTLR